MSKVMQMYGLTANEAMKLNPSQVNFLLENAQTTAESMLQNNTAFTQALKQKLAPVTRAVRSEIGTEDSSTD